MREIKFRAWDKTSKHMIMDYVHVGLYGELYTTCFHSSAYSDSGCPDLVLMQYTGLKDKNGKEIYEGDIIQTISCDGIKLSKFQVKWNNDFNKWEKIRQDGEIYDMDKISEENKITIGNIYENPELRVDK